MPTRQYPTISRRDFVKSAAAAAAVAGSLPQVAIAAPEDKPLKVGLVGCGHRGTEAARNAMTADARVKVVALADIRQEQIDTCTKKLADMIEIEKKNCFLGFDAYTQILNADVDYVILATPPYYRPEHFKACIDAGKHVFMEKPVAVDPVGIRTILAAGEQADEKKLSVVAGTQRRHTDSYIQTISKIREGAIGKILAAQCYWNQGQLWHKERAKGESDLDYMHRDWVNWCWLSGDHIVEQHVHNIDIINWTLGSHPDKVVAFGGRARRPSGDQYDFFSADFRYPDNVHVHSMCRQVNGCKVEIHERVIGQVGVSNCNGWISNFGMIKSKELDGYVQEHVDLISAIRTGKRINEAKNVAESTLCAIMARESAYTGQEITWEQMMGSDLQLSPPDYKLTPENIRDHIPVPGKPLA